MLKSLKVRNYKSHKESVLHFSKKINVIVGDPLSGKTNLLRALLTLKDNRPLGFGYHSNFSLEPDTEIQVETFDSPNKVSLIKEEKKAVYRVGSHSFTGVRSGVPDEVTRALNLSDINIQRQLDQQFLICSSPGEAARIINRITKLENIDKWVSSLTSKINQENRDLRLLETQQKEAEKSLEAFRDLPEIETRLVVAETLDKHITKLVDDLEELGEDLSWLKDSDMVITNKRNFLKASVFVREAQDHLDNVLVSERDLLDVQKLSEINSVITDNTEFLKAKDFVEKAMTLTMVVIENQKLLRNAEITCSEYHRLESEISGKEEKIQTTKSSMIEWIGRELDGLCPLCLSKTKHMTPEHVMEVFG